MSRREPSRRGLLIAVVVLLASMGPVLSALIPTLIPIPNPASQAGAGFGSTVAGLNDVNGDGIPDLVVGAPGADKVQILSGADRSVIRTITDPDGLTGKQSGFSVANVGDVN